jgi:transcriptional regulator with XRE-family HTH domain
MTIKNSLNHELSVPTAMVIANILKVRNQKKYTQAYMAHCLGITERAYQKIEQGKNKSITVDMISKIANALETDWTDLLESGNNKIQHNIDNKECEINHTKIVNNQDSAHEIEKLQLQLSAKEQENAHLKEKITSQAAEIENLKEIIALMKEKK